MNVLNGRTAYLEVHKKKGEGGLVGLPIVLDDFDGHFEEIVDLLSDFVANLVPIFFYLDGLFSHQYLYHVETDKDGDQLK